MQQTFKVACIQNRAGPDMRQNLDRAIQAVGIARNRGAQLIALPEFFSCLNVEEKSLAVGAATETEHPALEEFGNAARESGAWVLLGSLAIRDGDRLRNRSYMLSPEGAIVARYDKIHMFDVDLSEGERYRESETFAPGDRAVVAHTELAAIGMSVCYDLRFAYLYRALAQAGATVMMVPAAFMHTTGKAHWHVLLRARAIETGSYVVAPCQNGEHGTARTYGHSLIIDPWGTIIAEGHADEEDIVIGDIDLDQVADARGRVPALKHDRGFSTPDKLAPAPNAQAGSPA